MGTWLSPDVRSARLWAGLLGLVKVVVESVEFDEDEQVIVVSVRPRKATKAALWEAVSWLRSGPGSSLEVLLRKCTSSGL